MFSSLRFDSSFLDSLSALCWNALAKACPFDLGSLCVGVVLFGPVSPGSWPGGSLGSVAGLALVSFVSCCFLVIQDHNLRLRLTVSPAKRASLKFMKMVSFCLSHSL